VDSKEYVVMPKAITILKFIFIFFIIAMFTACVPAKKNPYYGKRKNASRVNASQLGRNKYYFSSGYQSKLKKNYKK
jgi:hypothetical protein